MQPFLPEATSASELAYLRDDEPKAIEAQIKAIKKVEMPLKADAIAAKRISHAAFYGEAGPDAIKDNTKIAVRCFDI